MERTARTHRICVERARTGVTRALATIVAATTLGPAGALLMPARIVAGNVCPPNFTLGGAPSPSSRFWKDRNGDGLQCAKNQNSPEILVLVFIDNNVPQDETSGVTSEGESVVVDTDSGAVSE